MSWRKLNVNNKTWQYITGTTGTKLRSPEDKVTWVKHHELLGMTEELYKQEIRMWRDINDKLDADGYKKHSDFPFSITPKLIKEYILRETK